MAAIAAGRSPRLGRAVLVLALLGVPGYLQAVEVRVVIGVAGTVTSPAEPFAGTVFLEPQGEPPSRSSAQVRSFEVELPGETVTELDPGLWRLRLEAPGLWLEPVLLQVEDEAGGVELDAWPTGSVVGEVLFPDAPRDADPVREPVTASFAAAPGTRKLPEDLRGTVECSREERRLRCSLPAGDLDVAFAAGSTTRHHVWGLRVKPGGVVKLDPIVLRRGAAVEGWVRVVESDVEVEGARITLSPYQGGPGAADAGPRLQRLTQSTTVNDRGFFELYGVVPGRYVLEAKKAPLAPVRATVEVRPDEVTEVANPPLELAPYAKITVYVEPPVTPVGEAWRVEVARIDRSYRVLATLADAEVPLGGAWEHSAVPPGRYLLKLLPGPGQKAWFYSVLEVDVHAEPLFIHLPLQRIEGRVLLGKEPLMATLWFGGEDELVSVPLQSDAEGRYEGVLPRPGEWKVDVVATGGGLRRRLPAVEVKHNPVKGRAEVDLHLPNTLLQGIVVDEEDRPVDAVVTVMNIEDRSSEHETTDEAGEFTLVGLPVGPTTINADAGSARSEEVEVELRDGEEAEVRLVVRPQLRIQGTVVAEGRPVPGALVFAEAPGFRGLLTPLSTTNFEGRFEMSLPRGVGAFFLAVGAPGFAFRLLRFAPDVEMPLTIPVSPEAGTLVLDIGDTLNLKDPRSPGIFLLHAGVLATPGYFLTWLPHHDVEWPAEGHGRHEVPRLEPGWYSACTLPRQQRWQFWQTGEGDARCVQGYLAPAGELVLSVPVE